MKRKEVKKIWMPTKMMLELRCKKVEVCLHTKMLKMRLCHLWLMYFWLVVLIPLRNILHHPWTLDYQQNNKKALASYPSERSKNHLWRAKWVRLSAERMMFVPLASFAWFELFLWWLHRWCCVIRDNMLELPLLMSE